jgi:hypothetical protein
MSAVAVPTIPALMNVLRFIPFFSADSMSHPPFGYHHVVSKASPKKPATAEGAEEC